MVCVCMYGQSLMWSLSLAVRCNCVFVISAGVAVAAVLHTVSHTHGFHCHFHV